jgi:DNA repair exonuclease SbcCD ATPase subunit
LQGIMEVTAAHEMLHAAYDRLSDADRERLGEKLKRAARRVQDPRLLKVLKEYETNQPNIFVNELHSHLGTELQDLGDPELEEHYEQYFENRQQVVALARQSQSSLAKLDAIAKTLKPEIDRLEKDLKTQAQTIKQIDLDLKAGLESLELMKSDLLNLKERAEQSFRLTPTGNAELIASFESTKARFNDEVANHNEQVRLNQDRIAEYNNQLDVYKKKIKAYNELAQKERSILNSLKPEDSLPNLQKTTP